MYFDNIRYERIIDAASELGLITVVHAGVDPKCTLYTGDGKKGSG